MSRTLEELQKIFKEDRFATDAGMAIVSAREGDAVCSVTLGPQHQNAAGGVQGGVIFTLADFAFAVASNCGEETVVSLKSDITFMRGTRGSVLSAHAKKLSASRKICFYEVSVTDDQGVLVASVTITGYIKAQTSFFG